MALGTQAVTQGDVLYLALEDNARRLQGRTRQLLSSMRSVPGGIHFALDWPRLGEGGLAALEEYLKEHPGVRLVVIDTWARVAPPSGERRQSQYEGDYEALIPLKRLADTYHVSILAVHHLRKTSSSDVLDEITGSIGMTGAVDGTLILKRERGQTEATLFVTGRDIEREQQLALSFDATQALWSVIGDSEEVGRTRARQEIIELLREQQEGMSSREIAEALKKNYHTTRSILRKMEGMGEIAHLQGRYLTLSMKRSPEQVQLTKGNGHIKHIQHHQRREQAASIEERCDGHTGTHQSDASDYVDYTAAADDMNGLPVAPFDYTDYADATDYGIDTSVESVTSEGPLNGVANVEEGMASIPLCTDRALLQEVDHQQEPAVITVINRNQCNQLPASERPVEVQGVPHNEANQGAATVTGEATPPNNRCPHHPRARMVRFDPAGQAWCDRLDCWDCYRLMKIGEVLGYRRLTE